jgi:hypothetical protein
MYTGQQTLNPAFEQHAQASRSAYRRLVRAIYHRPSPGYLSLASGLRQQSGRWVCRRSC